MYASQSQIAALDAARRGWHVFPLHENSKTPAITAWEQQATTDATRIKSWWPTNSRKNIGVACGPSGLHVIDLDDAHGHEPPSDWAGARHGRDVLARIAAERHQPMPTDTRIIATPNKGWHLWHLAPGEPELRNTQGKLGWRIDSRAAGGYVVGPGSISAHGTYRVDHHAPVAPLPLWLVEAFTPPPRPQPIRIALDLRSSTLRTNAYVATVAEGVARAQPGTRHITLLKAANSLGRLVAGGDLDESDARAALHNAAANLGADFPVREAEKTISDGLTHGALYPRQLAAG